MPNNIAILVKEGTKTPVVKRMKAIPYTEKFVITDCIAFFDSEGGILCYF